MVKLRIVLPCIATLVFTGCSIHKPDIQQGNVLESEKIEKLTLGMDRNQVRFLMGTPLINDVFHHTRWDYVYRFEVVDQTVETGRVTVIFENDVVAKIEKIPLTVESD